MKVDVKILNISYLLKKKYMNKWVMIWSIKTRDTNKFNNKYTR